MRNFIKDNSGVIVKFILTHIVMSILGIMVGLAIMAFDDSESGVSFIAVIGSIFTIGFMCFMHYDDMYFAAVKEGIRIRSEGGKPDLLKGLKISLIAYSPVILVGLAVIGFQLFASDVENLSAVPMLIYYALQGSYLCLSAPILEFCGQIGYVVITLIPAIVVGTLSYALGLQDKTLRGVLGMKVKPPYDGPMERKPNNKK